MGHGRLVIAIDGKTVRGAKDKTGKAPHLVAALAHGIGAVLGQVAVDAKSNEIPAVRELLTAFASLAGAVITIDAMHTQADTAQVILGQGADYVMTVKANMPTLHRKLKKLPWAAVPAFSAVTTDHGRRACRTIKVTLVPAWIGFDGAAQVAQVRRTVTKNGRKTVEVVYPDIPISATYCNWYEWSFPAIAQRTGLTSNEQFPQDSEVTVRLRTVAIPASRIHSVSDRMRKIRVWPRRAITFRADQPRYAFLRLAMRSLEGGR